MLRKTIILVWFITLASLYKTYAQPVTLYETFLGNYDFTAIGNTLNLQENGLNVPCEILTSSSADLTLEADQNIIAAYLYWAGSGTGDFNVSLNGTPIVAERTFLINFTQGITYPMFGAFADVTAQVQTTGNGTYTLSDLDLTSVIGGIPNYCQIALNFGGWSIIIVYEDPDLSYNLVSVYDGFEFVAQTNPILDITLTGLNISATEGAKIGFLAWEGDSFTAVNESLKVNGITMSNPPLNPATNAFNGTNSYTGNSGMNNMDLDYYDISEIISPGDTTLGIQLTSGQDLVIVNNIVVAVPVHLPDATVVINSVEGDEICNNRELTINYTVSNFDGTAELPEGIPISFYAEDIYLETVFTRSIIAIGEILTLEIVIEIPDTIPYDLQLTAVVDDNGSGQGIQFEINEGNNTANLEILLQAPIEPPVLINQEVCSDIEEVVFNLLESIPANLNLNFNFYTSPEDAENQENPITNISDFLSGTTAIWVHFTRNNTVCTAISQFDLIVNLNPV